MSSGRIGPSTQGARGYRSVRRLARGGMGQVEIVVRREGRFQRVYALKRLHPQYAADPQVRAMFVDEARIAGLIRHANAVSVLDVGEDAEGAFLVMDYIDGPSVSRLAEAARRRGLTLPTPIALEIARQAALGLHAAHELRSPAGLPLEVVHRDVSPQNLLVGLDGTVRVTDFGVARALDRVTQTDVGCLKGKVGYMSPEQLRFASLDRRADLFSLGVVLFELCAGQRLYAGDRAAVFRRVLEEPPPSLRARGVDVPAEVDRLVLAMLAKDPADRPASAREVAAHLDRALHATGGAVDLAVFLERHFPDEHERQRALLAEALTRGEAAPAPTERASVPRRASALAMVAASVVLFTGALALGYALAFTPPPVPAPAAPDLPARAATAPAPAAPPIAPAPTPRPEVAAPTPAPAGEPEAVSAPRVRRPAARRRPPGAPVRPRPASAVPRWEWDEGAR